MYSCATCYAKFEKLSFIKEDGGEFCVCPVCGSSELKCDKMLPVVTADMVFDSLIAAIKEINCCLEGKVGQANPADTLGMVYGYLTGLLCRICGDDGELENNLYCLMSEGGLSRCREAFKRQCEMQVPI